MRPKRKPKMKVDRREKRKEGEITVVITSPVG
jgi:hypothetical protein